MRRHGAWRRCGCRRCAAGTMPPGDFGPALAACASASDVAASRHQRSRAGRVQPSATAAASASATSLARRQLQGGGHGRSSASAAGQRQPIAAGRAARPAHVQSRTSPAPG
eukprot:988095-Alexandrium_andersonii.AAC.1